MDIDAVLLEICDVSDAVIGEAALPNFQIAPELLFDSMRISAFDELHGAFERNVEGCEKKMNMLWHQHESVQEEFRLSAIRIKGLQEKSGHRFRDK